MHSPTVPALSESLREGTRAAHRVAESSPFMRELFAARLSIHAYRVFLCQLYRIYSTLEDCSEHFQSDPILKTFYFPALFRRAALEQDLQFYFGNGSWREVPPLEATQTYVQRILTVAQDWPLGLIAHHYTRYLGDLSGGQVLKRVVAKMYHLPSQDGLAFYNFPLIPDQSGFKKEYRARLDALPIDEMTAQEIVTEANRAFELNRQLLEEMMVIGEQLS